MRRRTAATAAGVLCALLLLLTGCSQRHYDERGKGDAPVRGQRGEDSPAEVYDFPDGFGNLATKCVGEGKRAYTTTKTYRQEDDEEPPRFIPSHEVIVDDSECTGTATRTATESATETRTETTTETGTGAGTVTGSG